MKRVSWLSLLLAGLLMVSSAIMSPVYAQEEEVAEAEAGADDEQGPAAATRYVDLKPAFVVNYGGAGRLRYLKTDIALRVGGGDKGASAIRHHMPYIRHRLVMLLSKASEEDLSSMEGKELLRQNALEAVREVLMQEEGQQHVVDLLFNSFIVQR